jgi:ABC transport system ATP-binding/permease protein
VAVLLNCQSLSKSFGVRPLFKGITLTLNDGERAGLIGPNGSGKSTLLKIMAGREQQDDGTISLKRQLCLGYLPQVETFPAEQPIDEIVREALVDTVHDEHERELRAARLLTQVGFDPDRQQAHFGTLSGGWRKRAALARELAREPDLLLLDEPTNHLDLDGVLWLEKMLRNAPFGFLLVSHDRYFLERVTNRVIELNACYPEGYFSAIGNYSEFLTHREAFLEGQMQQQRALESKVRREVEWLRRGPPARTTKSRARIDEAGKLIDELSNVTQRNAQGQAIQVDFTSSGRQANKLLTMKNVSKSLGGNKLIDDLSLLFSPGMKLGLIGRNGTGKTTLIRMITGELEPDAGTIARAENLNVVCFDQNREQLDPDWTLAHALSPAGDRVTYRGQVIHVNGWAVRFLFRPEQLQMPVSSLSGGEQSRVLLARLMLRPADLLLLDEPTNDLDIASLEILEESLASFPGAVVLVTHDRYLLQRLECNILGFDGEGVVRGFNDYAQWESAFAEARKNESKQPSGSTGQFSGQGSKNSKKLTFKEKQEWERMEALIQEAEARTEEVQKQLEDPAVAADHVKLLDACNALADAQQATDRLYARWQELEEKQR